MEPCSATTHHNDLAGQSVNTARTAIRSGSYSGHTAGLCADKLQCNLIILNAEEARDFERFCNQNPKTCPLIAVSEVGSPIFEKLGAGIDLRTDVPSYNIYKCGKLTDTLTDIKAYWSGDMVAFAIGCSFTFERALIAAGIPMRHIDHDLTVPMYQSTIPLKAAGVFGGHAVVSMRPIKNKDIDKVYEICNHYPHAHGEPMHVGRPDELGIEDINNPTWGDAVEVKPDETPVFWGCGVTTQSAILTAKVDLCISHTPGCMLITDVDELSNSDWRSADPAAELPTHRRRGEIS